MSDNLLDVHAIGRLLVTIFRLAWWLVETIALGARSALRIVAALARSPVVFRQSLRCPRQHSVPTYGIWRCSKCRAAIEGWAFGKCPVCAHRATWVACPRCQLAVQGPWR